ncbi:hypothetical protein D3C81_1962740 [compost metagenome]
MRKVRVPAFIARAQVAQHRGRGQHPGCLRRVLQQPGQQRRLRAGHGGAERPQGVVEIEGEGGDLGQAHGAGTLRIGAGDGVW